MNKLRLEYDFAYPFRNSKAFLNDEEITNETKRIEFDLEGAFVVLIDREETERQQEIIEKKVRFDDFELVKLG